MDAKTVINLGLGKIAANLITSITPPKSAIERHCANGYATWRDSELEIRTWYFSVQYRRLTTTPLANTDPVLSDGRVYKYPVPTDMVRAIRDKYTEWEQRGLFIYSRADTLTIPIIARVSEAQWPSTFVDVVACRVAKESVEFATQSNTKEDSAETKYDKAVIRAGKANAYVIGDQDARLDDYNDEWANARINPESVGWSQG